MASVELKSIKKKFGDVEIIHNLDLRIEPGEFTVFVGPSGCGKSTLLRMIAGLEDITAGDMLIDGERMNDVAAGQARHRHGVPVLRALSAYDRLREHGLRPGDGRLPEGRDRAAGAAAPPKSCRSSISSSASPSQLSGGQRQRVAIGRAIVREPRIFLFDEPLSNLDAELRVQMRVEIAKLHRELGTTMIYVTHDQVEAMTMADKIVVLRAGGSSRSARRWSSTTIPPTSSSPASSALPR